MGHVQPGHDRTRLYTTTNPELREYPLLGMPALQALGASLLLLSTEYQFSDDPNGDPGYGALEYRIRLHNKNADSKRSMPIITSDTHEDPCRGKGSDHVDPTRMDKLGGKANRRTIPRQSHSPAQSGGMGAGGS